MSETLSANKAIIWRWLRRGLIALFSLLLVGLFALLLVPFALQTDWGRGWAEREIESRRFLGQQLSIDGFGGDVLAEISAKEVTIADNEGVWLRINDLSLRWNVWSLGAQRLEISAVQAASLEALRPPALERSPERPRTRPSILDRWSLVLDSLSIDRVSVPDVAEPGLVAYRIAGMARLAANKGAVEFSLSGIGDSKDSAQLMLNWSERLPLSGEATVTLEPGSPLSQRFLLGEEQRLEVVFDAGLAGPGYRASLIAKVDEAELLSAQSEGPLNAVRLYAQVHLSAHKATKALVPRFGQSVTLEGVGDLETRQLEEVLVHSEKAELILTGVDQKDTGIKGDFSLTLPGQVLLASLPDGARIQYDGALQWEAGALLANGRALLTDMRHDKVSVGRASGPLQIQFSNSAVSMRAGLDLRGVQIPAAETITQGRIDGNLVYEHGAGHISFNQFKLALGSDTLTGRGKFQPVSRNLSLAGNFDYRSGRFGLAPLDRAMSTFSLDYQMGGEGRLALSDLTIATSSALRDLMGETLGGRAVIGFGPNGVLAVNEVALSGPAASLRGEGSRSASGAIKGGLEFAARGKSRLNTSFPGLAANLRVEQARHDAPLVLMLNANADAVSRLPLGNEAFVLQAKGVWDEKRLDGEGSLALAVAEAPLNAEFALGFSGDDVSVTLHKVQWTTLLARGALSVPPGDPSGLRAKASLNGSWNRGADVENLSAILDWTPAEISLDAAIQGLRPGPDSRIDMRLTARGKPEHFSTDLHVSGPIRIRDAVHPVLADISGDVTNLMTNERFLAVIGSASIGPVALKTLETATVSGKFDDPLFDLVLGIGEEGKLTASRGRDLPQSASFVLEAIDPRAFCALAGVQPVAGRLEGNVQLTQQAGGWTGPISLRLAQLRAEEASLEPISLDLVGTLSSQQIAYELKSHPGDNLNLKVTGVQGFASRVALFSPLRLNDQPASAEFAIQGAIDSISALFVPYTMTLTGEVEARMTLRYGDRATELDGDFSLKGGTLEHVDLGTKLTDIGLRLRGQGERLRLEELTATGPGGGTLSGSGTADLRAGAGSRIAVRANAIRLIDRAEGFLVTSGVLDIERGANRWRLGGALTVDEALVRIEALPTPRAPTLKVRFANGDTDAGDAPRSSVLAFDVTASAPRRLMVEGRGLNAELSLALGLEGTLREPRIDGIAEVLRGRLSLLGKRFELVEGQVQLANRAEDVTLFIIAERSSEDVDAVITVTGTVREPQIALSSTPALPEDEVLSRVLFGRAPSQLSALEAARLAAALTELSGGSGFNVLGGLEQITGLDRLDIAQNAGGALELTTGKYLSEDVYLEVRSTQEAAPRVTVEWTPRANVALEASTEAGQRQTLSIKWKDEFGKTPPEASH